MFLNMLVICRAKLSQNSDKNEIQEQLQYMEENRKLAVELGLDTMEMFGCYACGFTATTQKEVCH